MKSRVYGRWCFNDGYVQEVDDKYDFNDVSKISINNPNIRGESFSKFLSGKFELSLLKNNEI